MTTLASGLESFVGSILSRGAWGASLLSSRGAFDPSTVDLKSSRVEAMLDVSLLRWPYFSVLRSGEVPATERYTRSRNVIGHPREGFIDGPAVRRLMDAGGTLKLNRIADWDREMRLCKRRLEQLLPAAVSVFGFYTPRGQQGMLPHRDASHVVVAQIAGSKRWSVYGAQGDVHGHAGTDVDPASNPTEELTLNPGDLMYMPHGWPHQAVGGDEGSWHVTFTLTEPTIEELVEAILQRAVTQNEWMTRSFHQLDIPTRTEAVRDATAATLAATSHNDLLEQALTTLRSRHA